jgi:hypothetical protein
MHTLTAPLTNSREVLGAQVKRRTGAGVGGSLGAHIPSVTASQIRDPASSNRLDHAARDSAPAFAIWRCLAFGRALTSVLRNVAQAS